MIQSTPNRPTWAEIDLTALAENFWSVRNFVGPEIAFMAIVKADAYGHGAVASARRLEREGADWLGVAIVEEGLELRRAGIAKPILCLGGSWPGQERALLQSLLTPAIFRIDAAERLNAVAGERRCVADVHLKVDTGMNRLGVRFDEFGEFLDRFRQFTNLRVEGVMTHFAAADSLENIHFTDLQIERFEDCVTRLRAAGFAPRFLDLANSPGAVVHPRSRGNMVSIGGLLYGLGRD
ncbi:MAG: alanine racemase, partial [Acidobacteria bacterium]|nr:alanine racemase [Acidobacteriota bacterium]